MTPLNFLPVTTAAKTSSTWPHSGGAGAICVTGTLDGTITLQASPDGGTTWVAVTDGTSTCSLAAVGWKGYTLPPCLLRAVLSADTATTVTVYHGRSVWGNVNGGD